MIAAEGGCYGRIYVAMSLGMFGQGVVGRSFYTYFYMYAGAWVPLSETCERGIGVCN